MNKKTIFFDLDGTILDVSERIYQIYKRILKKHNKKFLSKKEYIKLKQEKKPTLEILKKTEAGGILSEFKKAWVEDIEKQEFLKLDVFPLSAKKILLKARKKYRLVLVTLRDNPQSLEKELRKKKIINLFDKILLRSGGGAKEKWKIKYRLIKRYTDCSNSIIVGDTETDILTGKKLGIKTIAVTTGMRSRKILMGYEPNLLIKNISETNNIF